MKIIIAHHAGFCMGVRKAILKIISVINKNKDVEIYGSLIHNPQTISILENRGMKTITSLSDIDNKTIAIRTHGIPVQELKEIKSRAQKMVNLTCPRVAKVQGIVKKHTELGYHTIITGDPDHIEVQSIKSYGDGNVTIIASEKDLKNIPQKEKYILVSQTTFNIELFNKLSEKLQKELNNLKVINTICNSTHLRQNEVKEILNKENIDTLVVVGGNNSANTTRLAGIGREAKVKTFHIETEKELSAENFKNSKKVFVTAGASTPGWLINNVLEKIYTLKFKSSGKIVSAIFWFFNFCLRINLIPAIVAFFIPLILSNFLHYSTNYLISIMSAGYIFSMHTLNNCFELEDLEIRNPYKFRIFSKYKILFLILAAVSNICSQIIAFNFNWTWFLFILTLTLFGALYPTTYIQSKIKKYNQIPIINFVTDKNIITANGWAFSTVLVPLLLLKAPINSIIIFYLLIFTMIFMRQLALDIISYQGDIILGRNSIPVELGLKASQIISTVSCIIAIAALSTFLVNTANFLYFLYIIPLLIFLFMIYYMCKFSYLIAIKYEMLIDSNLLILILLYFII